MLLKVVGYFSIVSFLPCFWNNVQDFRHVSINSILLSTLGLLMRLSRCTIPRMMSRLYREVSDLYSVEGKFI